MKKLKTIRLRPGETLQLAIKIEQGPTAANPALAALEKIVAHLEKEIAAKEPVVRTPTE